MTSNAASPTQHIWWLMSRASGIVALGLITASVALGLAMAGRLFRGRRYAAIHEHLSLAGLVAITVHGLTLLGDPWLHPGVSGIAVPFRMGYRTAFTGLGIVGGDLAAVLGLSFYIRRRIGTRVWRRLHRLTAAVYALVVIHTLGAGTDASTPWLRGFLLVTAVPVGALLLLRTIPRRRRSAKRRPLPSDHGGNDTGPTPSVVRSPTHWAEVGIAAHCSVPVAGGAERRSGGGTGYGAASPNSGQTGSSWPSGRPGGRRR